MKFSDYTILLIFSLTLAFTNATKGQEVIPFEKTSEGHLLIKAKINGKEGNFIFDTGGGLTVLTKKFASDIQSLKKQDGSYTAYRATGERLDCELYTAEELAIGKFTQKASTLTIIDADFGQIDGLISLMSFQSQPVTIDFKEKKLYLETVRSLSKRKKNAAVIPLQLQSERDKALDIFVYFVFNNKLTLQFSLDSGAGDNVFNINARYITVFGSDAADSSKVKKIVKQSVFDRNIKTAIYKTKVSELSFRDFRGIKIENFTASFVEGLIYDGVVSINWIGNEITFDISKKEMIVR